MQSIKCRAEFGLCRWGVRHELFPEPRLLTLVKSANPLGESSDSELGFLVSHSALMGKRRL
uniref:Uncharacterized protein n=1 Tax=Physcomitrium patens TaxID=3218 RepID=A0A7I4D6Z5_PHYPA